MRDILERGDEFETPYGPEMAELARGSNFILGMQDGAAYRQMKSAVLSAFPPAEVEAAVRPIAERHSRDIMTRASPGFDASPGQWPYNVNIDSPSDVEPKVAALEGTPWTAIKVYSFLTAPSYDAIVTSARATPPVVVA